MTVFSAGNQFSPVKYTAEVSQRLLKASHSGDLISAFNCIADPFVDVNFVGVVTLRTRRTELVLCDESPSQVRIEFDEFKSDVTPLFLAVHAGNAKLVRKLLNVGADVNQKLFRGFATTAAVREGHLNILQMLLKAGASQPACEEALLEACCHGHAKLAELLMISDLIRPHITVHALVTACCRGFIDVIETLIKCGVDVSATDRLLLQSIKPSLHRNVDCTALFAAVIHRQISVVCLLLKNGARIDYEARLGAWSWDMSTGEEIRVGAGLGECYPITWCAVEYFEKSGAILLMLLHHVSHNAPHRGRTLLHHAILCGNVEAVRVLLECGVDVESPVKTTTCQTKFHPIHMASRLGLSTIVQCLIDFGCDLNSTTDAGDTALMICAKYKQEKCFKVLASAGVDFGIVNTAGQSVCSISESTDWWLGFQQAVLQTIRNGKIPKSRNPSAFSPIMFAAQAEDAESLKIVIGSGEFDLDYQDDNGFSAVMVTALKGHVESFRLLVYAGANLNLCNKSGETTLTLFEFNPRSDLFKKVMLEFALHKINCNMVGFYALHYAAHDGNSSAVKLLTSKGYDVNALDGGHYTPLMLAAREGHRSICELLISNGANCSIKNTRGETALSLARNKGLKNDAEAVILDELARRLVLGGAYVQKHTKGGKGSPHGKRLQMLESKGVLRWGKSACKNVICREAELGPSLTFRRNRYKKSDVDDPGMFRVLTKKNKEVHFVCGGGLEVAELWVRGIKLVNESHKTYK
ncbi:putative ankyrin repeat-containing domain-containing protein [Lupinus albus]|uniref:Putative ankyrin repeat-containing domain-containing protein n=1 Tax=Lupinus albus TaxID=3870 RepID=A0A6A4QZL8_LUPAL|nr:putative ankyrin repeat-containing domain-containing protein [Lupinus albus]